MSDAAGTRLQDALSALAASTSTGPLSGAWAEVSERYRGGQATAAGGSFTADHALAYAIGRAPATTAAVRAVLDAVVARMPGWAPTSMIDVGAGLGTASWQAMERLPSIGTAELVERSATMIDGGRALASGAPAAVAGRSCHQGDVAELGGRRADLVLASYVLSELDDAAASRAVDAWWTAASDALVIVDTGTPAGFARVLAARRQLLDLGGELVAPCPSDGPCPMAGTDWCHFSVRLARSAAHRELKGAELPYEDEKFSYLVVSRSPVDPAPGRVVRHPQVRGGHIRLQVCHDDVVTEEVVGKSRRDLYRWARKASWGDETPPDLVGQ